MGDLTSGGGRGNTGVHELLERALRETTTILEHQQERAVRLDLLAREIAGHGRVDQLHRLTALSSQVVDDGRDALDLLDTSSDLLDLVGFDDGDDGP